MTSVDGYLDQACLRLGVNPAEADDVREELRSHLEELIQSYRAQGMSSRQATQRALAWFGDAHKVQDSLERVHRGEAWWLRRLRGMAAGMLLGGLLAALLPFGGHLELAHRLFASLAAWDGARAQLVANGVLVGGVIGLISAARGLFVGWVVGSLVWFGEHITYWFLGTVCNSFAPEQGMSVFNCVLLSPVLGGLFGAAVGVGASAILAVTSRPRPEIR